MTITLIEKLSLQETPHNWAGGAEEGCECNNARSVEHWDSNKCTSERREGGAAVGTRPGESRGNINKITKTQSASAAVA